MVRFCQELRDVAGVFVHSIQIGDNASQDKRRSLFDNVGKQVMISSIVCFCTDINSLQIEEVCQQLKSISELADGFDAVGISQGGQFLRAYVERCNDPPVRNLITIGAQHQGVMALPGCPADNEDCGWWNKLMKLGVFNPLIHHKIVQAQYYKNPNELGKYMAINDFLTDINNEKENKNPRYKENLSSLQKFVMYMFEEDKMVVPKESSVRRKN